MEQYVHLFISKEAEFEPEADQVERFFEGIVEHSGFRMGSSSGLESGFLLLKPSDRVRTGKNPWTGEEIRIPALDRSQIGTTDQIPAAIEGLSHYLIFASGEWPLGNRPLQVFETNGKPFDPSVPLACNVSCNLRPRPVSTSGYNYLTDSIERIPDFGEPCESPIDRGFFRDPWMNTAIEIPHAGCARFWIEFELGKFLFPKISGSLDLADPALLALTESIFETPFVQGCRFN
jgi:hypothetical protein